MSNHVISKFIALSGTQKSMKTQNRRLIKVPGPLFPCVLFTCSNLTLGVIIDKLHKLGKNSAHKTQ